MGDKPLSVQLDIIVERFLQVTAVCYHMSFMFLMPFVAMFLPLYLIQTSWWPLVILYFTWLIYDWKSPKRGGYPSNWWRTQRIHQYFASYFPVQIHLTTPLTPGKNYLIGSHPHGIISLNTCANFLTNGTGIFEKLPHMTIRICTLVSQFWTPIRREWGMLHGFIDCSKESLLYVLNSDKSINNVVILIVGGAEEALDAHPGSHIITLNKRKGFVKTALQTGAQLVPMYCFGENELFKQVSNPEGSFLRSLQKRIKRIIKFSLPICHGCGIFSRFGPLPYRTPVNTVIGAPIPVVKNDNPTDEEIERLHGIYIRALVDLFETHKSDYGVPKHVSLVIR